MIGRFVARLVFTALGGMFWVLTAVGILANRRIGGMELAFVLAGALAIRVADLWTVYVSDYPDPELPK